MDFEDAPLLTDAFPELVEELRGRMVDYWLTQPAERERMESFMVQLAQLRVVARWRCDNDFCGSFWVSTGEPIIPRLSRGGFSFDKTDIILHSEENRQIREIEVLFRPEYKRQRDVLNLPAMDPAQGMSWPPSS